MELHVLTAMVLTSFSSHGVLWRLQNPNAQTSSMVDDVFFIARKCGRRAMATSSHQCVCALLGEINNLLANEFR